MQIDQKGTIIIDYRHGENPLADVEFKVYHIASLENGECSLLPKYQWADIDIDQLSHNSYWVEASEYLENAINYDMIEPEAVFLTDDYGNYKLEDLDLGLYFIQSEMVEEGAIEIYSDPILIMVGKQDGDKYLYHYTVEPKIATLSVESHDLKVQKVWENIEPFTDIPDEIEVEVRCDGDIYDVVILSEENDWQYIWHDIDENCIWAINENTKFEDYEVSYEKNFFEFTVENMFQGEIEEPETKSEEPETKPETTTGTVQPAETLPQTGTNANMIPLYAAVGMIFLLVGVILRGRKKRKDEED